MKKKYGYGKWVQLEHDGRGCANMTVDGKFFRAVEPNVYDAGTSCVWVELKEKKKKKICDGLYVIVLVFPQSL